MGTRKLLQRVLVTVLLLTGSAAGLAEEADLCAPFMGGKVNESLLATMSCG